MCVNIKLGIHSFCLELSYTTTNQDKCAINTVLNVLMTLFGWWESTAGPSPGEGALVQAHSHSVHQGLHVPSDDWILQPFLCSIWAILNVCTVCFAIIWPPLGVTELFICLVLLFPSLRLSASHTLMCLGITWDLVEMQTVIQQASSGWSLRCCISNKME